MLYSRMIIIMVVSLYTSRILLEALGVVDLGIYSIIAGVIILFGFIQNVTTLGTQRFLSVGLGKEDYEWTNKAFNTSIIVHIIISLIVLALGETIGVWFVNTQLNIPETRIDDINWIFQFSLLALVVQLLQTPYTAAMIACEKMELYARIGIIDAFQRWFIVFLLIQFDFVDKLKVYSVFVFLGFAFVFFCYFICSIRNFDICRLNLKIDFRILSEMFSFSGWTLLGSLSVVSLSQGIAILVNLVSGVVANASLGLSEQVLMAINRLTGNFQTAFNPQIIKSYVSGNISYLHQLLSQSSKLSFFLVLLAVTPLYVDTYYILSLWLGTVPEYLVSLVRVVSIYILIDCLSGPFVTVIYAVGNLKRYQLTISLVMLVNLALAAILVYINAPLYMVLLSRVSCVFILLMYRFLIVGRLIDFKLFSYFKEVILRLIVVGVISFCIVFFVHEYLRADFIGLLYLVALSTLVITFLFYFLAFTTNEREFCKGKVKFIWKKFLSK
ncbi:O-antigen/teichoic acid export membrane protein [Raoultella terrigena]|nr:O-antigen/teichoic acid export membrane protein [Raoultella terrigena]